MNLRTPLESNLAAAAEICPARVPKATVADRYSVTVRTVENWMKKRLIPYHKIGGVVRFDMAKVEESLGRHEIKAK